MRFVGNEKSSHQTRGFLVSHKSPLVETHLPLWCTSGLPTAAHSACAAALNLPRIFNWISMGWQLGQVTRGLCAPWLQSPCQVPCRDWAHVCLSQAGVGQGPKQMLCPHHGGANPVPSVLPSYGHLRTGQQGGHPPQEAKPWLCMSRSTQGQGQSSSSLLWFSWLMVWRGSSCKRPPSFCFLFSPVKRAPLLYAAHTTMQTCAFCTGIKKNPSKQQNKTQRSTKLYWPVCQSWAFDCMVDYQPPNWIHEDPIPASWPEFQKYIHKGVTFKDVSMNLWCFSQ